MRHGQYRGAQWKRDRDASNCALDEQQQLDIMRIIGTAYVRTKRQDRGVAQEVAQCTRDSMCYDLDEAELVSKAS